MFDDKNLGKLTKEDEDYRANKIPRDCSCTMSVYQKDYNTHLKSGGHNSHFKSRAPSEVKTPVG